VEWRVHGWGRTTDVIPSRSRRIDMTDPKRPQLPDSERIEEIWRHASDAMVSPDDWLETADDDEVDEDDDADEDDDDEEDVDDDEDEEEDDDDDDDKEDET
jgi:hypothetical protein